jgi:hypothetical protein
MRFICKILSGIAFPFLAVVIFNITIIVVWGRGLYKVQPLHHTLEFSDSTSGGSRRKRKHRSHLFLFLLLLETWLPMCVSHI